MRLQLTRVRGAPAGKFQLDLDVVRPSGADVDMFVDVIRQELAA